MPNPWRVCQGAGDPCCWGESRAETREAQALLALARQLTPQAHERGAWTLRAFRLAAYIVNVVVLSLAVAVPAASAAQQSGGEAYESAETKRAKKAAQYKAAQRALV